MRPGYGLFQQQAASMQLTPQLQQAIKILQLSTPDLLAYIQQELDENPILEFAENEWGEYHTSHQGNPGIGRSSQDDDPLRHAVRQDVSLQSHLKEQLGFIREIPGSVRRIVLFIIGSLDNNGYLGLSVDEIAEMLQEEPAQAELALRILQGFDPIGVGAKDLRECLLLQVERLPEYAPLAVLLINHHLQDVADYRIHKLSMIFHVSAQEVQAAIDVIKRLSPRPGAAFHTEEVRYIIPDVAIEKAGEQFIVLIHDAASPRLSVNGEYERMVRESREHNEARKLLSNKLNSAKFFVKCMEQRRWTLFRVTQAIVEEQTDFFRKGISYLRPMTLKQIADKLDVHESTVSRATAGKYAQTPWGIFELKYFFPSGLQTDLGDSASSEHVKARIKEWVSGENRRKPYSDQKLADLMGKEGIQISRRTVTKYREELGISSSMRRKRI